MEKPSKFDQAIQDKLSGLRAEPSDRVWAAIRSEVGAADARKGFPWIRVAAAAGLLLIGSASLYWVMNQGQPDPATPANTFSDQGDRTWPSYFKRSKTAKEDDTLAKWPQSPSKTVQRQLVYTPAPKPAPLPQPDLQPREQIVKHEPKQNPLPAPTPAPAPVIEPQQEQAIASVETTPTGTKKTFKVPTSQDLTLENLRAKSKNVLETLASNANDKLGIPTDYQTQKTDEGEMTAFSLDLGFVKFRKVRNTR